MKNNGEYVKFLETKKQECRFDSIKINRDDINPMLYEFQKDIACWALRKGRACIFADCGLGKTPMQLEWANQVHKKTGKKTLILAPLAVAEQTKREGEKFNIGVKVCRTQSDATSPINIANYEMLEHFDSAEFVGIVLDESSILKSFTGKIRTKIIEMCKCIPYRLACTATPSPNDYMELGNHSEFMGAMTRAEMLSMFFVHDGSETQKWRLKGHAKNDYWKWVSSWAVVLKNPSDLGYENNGFILPPMETNVHYVDSHVAEGMLIPMAVNTLAERRVARKVSLGKRTELIADKVNNSSEMFLIWCDYNAEGEALKKAISGAVEVKGPDKHDHKTKALLDFAEGNIRVLVTKPKIAGFGMNWQICNNVIFCGLSDSYEAYYQAMRRCWRFGQKNPVTVDIVISESEQTVLQNVKRKQSLADEMSKYMIANTCEITKKDLRGHARSFGNYQAKKRMEVPSWLK
ncbi:MAG: helicase [FCB group bacterium]|nr:helicase [FCB group bacterium]